MKKIGFLSILLTVLFLLVSCNTNDDYTANYQEVANNAAITRSNEFNTSDDSFAKMLEELEETNQMVLSIYGNNNTRGRDKSKKWRIIAADGLGLGFGFKFGNAITGVIGGAGASLLAYLGFDIVAGLFGDITPRAGGQVSPFQRHIEQAYNYSFEDDYIDTLSYRLQIPIVYKEDCCAIGLMHNIVIDQIMNNSDIISDYNIYRIDTTLLRSQDYYDLCSDLYNNIINDNNLYNNNTNVDKVIYSFFLTLESCQETEMSIRLLTNDYVRIIERNNCLSTNDKMFIYTVITGSYYSFNYWDNYDYSPS